MKKELFQKFNSNPPANADLINKIQKAFGVDMPQDYIQFMIKSNGGEGFIGSNSYIIIWKLEDLIELNEAYQVSEYAPGIILFGSDGGGEAYGFDVRDKNIKIISIPFVGMDLNLIEIIGSDFSSFIDHLYQI